MPHTVRRGRHCNGGRHRVTCRSHCFCKDVICRIHFRNRDCAPFGLHCDHIFIDGNTAKHSVCKRFALNYGGVGLAHGHFRNHAKCGGHIQRGGNRLPHNIYTTISIRGRFIVAIGFGVSAGLWYSDPMLLRLRVSCGFPFRLALPKCER